MTETKEKKCLVTQHLIGSVKWALNAPMSIIKPDKGGDGKMTWAEKGRLDLENTLNRVWTGMPEPAQHGIDFEKMVYETANKNEDDWGGSDYFKQVCKEVQGFSFGEKGKKELEVDGHKCFLYGKYDGIKRKAETPEIKDIKTTAKYKPKKYLEGVQHKLYCYMENIKRFTYVIAEWEKFPKIKAVHLEEYIVTDFELLEHEVLNNVSHCLWDIKDMGLWDIYRNNYCLY